MQLCHPGWSCGADGTGACGGGPLTMCLQVRALPDCSRLCPHTSALPLTHLLPAVPCVHIAPDCHHPSTGGPTEVSPG